jgi:hypothetical protein
MVMRAAKQCGLEVAEVFYEPVTKLCVVKRFDRTLSERRIKRFFKWLFLNLMLGNNDSHAKNLSLFQSKGDHDRPIFPSADGLIGGGWSDGTNENPLRQ